MFWGSLPSTSLELDRLRASQTSQLGELAERVCEHVLPTICLQGKYDVVRVDFVLG